MFQRQAPAGEIFYFRPKEATEGDIYVIEATDFEKDRPGNFGPKDTGYARVHVFANGKGEPTVYERFSTEAKVLANTIGRAIGGAPLLVSLGQGRAKDGHNAPWVWVDEDPAKYPDIVAYFEKEQAADEEIDDLLDS